MEKISRRRFLSSSATGLAALCLSGPGLAAGTEKQFLQATLGKYSGFKMGVQSYSLRHFDVADAIGHVADLGLHWVEFYGAHLDGVPVRRGIGEVKAMLAPHRIALGVHGVHHFGGDEAQNRKLFEFARLAGIPVLSANPQPESFPILHDLVQEFDIKIGIHNHGPGHLYDRISDSLEAVEKWDERIGFCPDTGHYMRSGEDPVEMVHLLGDRLYGMHLKDHAGIHRNSPPETILGEGVIDLADLCAALRKIGFDRPLSLEYELDPESPVEGIRRGLDNFARAARATA